MGFIDKVISEVSLALEYLSGVAGVSSIFLICIISLVFLFFIFWFIILLKLRGIRKILIDVSRRMNAISIISRQQSSKKIQQLINTTANHLQAITHKINMLIEPKS